MIAKREVFLSVDVETSGPVPVDFALLSIGACHVDDPSQTFACQLKPTTRNADPKALEVAGLSLERLDRDGMAPEVAMAAFRTWILDVSGPDAVPVFVGFNASFDWSFVNYYFHHFLGENPFGFAALDIKSLYMGAARSSWKDTKSSQITKAVHPALQGNHDALQDALYQAELFRLIRRLK